MKKKLFSISPYLLTPKNPHKQARFIKEHTKTHEILLRYSDNNTSCKLLLLTVYYSMKYWETGDIYII